jgi:hypothetical protein
LYDDLGRLALSEGDFTDALSYYSAAEQAGSKTAGAAIALIKRLQIPPLDPQVARVAKCHGGAACRHQQLMSSPAIFGQSANFGELYT